MVAIDGGEHSSLGTVDSYATIDIGAKWTSKFNDGKTELEGLLGMHRDEFRREGIDPTQAADPLQLLVNKDLGTWGKGFQESQATISGCTDSGPGTADPYPFISNCPMNNRAYAVGGPGSQQAAVYRLQTRVRKFTTNPKLFPTFTLPRYVDLAQ